MKSIVKKFLIVLCIVAFTTNVGYADNFKKAEDFLKKAKLTNNKEEGYDYIHKARILYEEEYELNPINVRVLLGLSKVNQLLMDRENAKIYILKAYNMFPSDADLQREMGDFYYTFQEYSTAIEYYKLSLASGNLRDFNTNLKTAKCYEKLGDLENAELYYKICNHLDSKSREALNKVNEYESLKFSEEQKQQPEPKYKYLFKQKQKTESELIEDEANDIIENINTFY